MSNTEKNINYIMRTCVKDVLHKKSNFLALVLILTARPFAALPPNLALLFQRVIEKKVNELSLREREKEAAAKDSR